jgi:hypothetical protein
MVIKYGRALTEDIVIVLSSNGKGSGLEMMCEADLLCFSGET